MPKLKASREGSLVTLPKYQNAEWLLLEFFRNYVVRINPVGSVLIDGDAENFHAVRVYTTDVQLDTLIDFINANI